MDTTGLQLTGTEKYYYFWVMKIKAVINFILVLVGILAIFGGENFIQREYAQSVGFVLLMLGLYRISSSWKRSDNDDEDQ